MKLIISLAIQQNWQKFKDSQNQAHSNFENFQETFVQNFKQRIEKIESDIEFLGRKPENSMARKLNIAPKNETSDIKANDTAALTRSVMSENAVDEGDLRTNSTRESKSKLEYLEFIANDYKFGMIEAGALKSNIRLYKSAVSLDEKFDCMTFFIKHYKLIEEKLTKSSFQQFYELLSANRNNPRYISLSY